MSEKQIDLPFLLKVLQLTGEIDVCSDIWWRCDGEYGPVSIYVNCSDDFFPSLADCEEITPANIHLFEEAAKDIWSLGGDEFYIPTLFVAKVRRMRPINYPKNSRISGLFEDCGPERTDKPIDLVGMVARPVKETSKARELWQTFIEWLKRLWDALTNWNK